MDNEIISIVDELDRQIGISTRKEAHERSLLHRECGLLIIKDDKILLQKRAEKKNGKFDYSAAGHPYHFENYEQGIIRETHEEIGIKLDKDTIKFIGKFRQTIDRLPKHSVIEKFMAVYEIRKNYTEKDFSIDNSEIEYVKFFDRSEIKTMLEKDRMQFLEGLAEILEKVYL